MIKINTNEERYYKLFDNFDYFENFLKYAIRDTSPSIHVDSIANPKCVILYSKPAYFILSDSAILDENVFSALEKNSWIIPSSVKWKKQFESYYKDRIEVYPRVLFDSAKLNINHIISIRRPLPDGFRITPIREEHLKEGIIYQDVIRRFFTVSNFLEHGFGFALVDEEEVCQGFALTNHPVIGKKIEVYFRVGYADDPQYRGKGFGTMLCSYLLEFCLNNGYDPVWDAANEISSHIAKKFGYSVKAKWDMFHIL